MISTWLSLIFNCNGTQGESALFQANRDSTTQTSFFMNGIRYFVKKSYYRTTFTHWTQHINIHTLLFVLPPSTVSDTTTSPSPTIPQEIQSQKTPVHFYWFRDSGGKAALTARDECNLQLARDTWEKSENCSNKKPISTSLYWFCCINRPDSNIRVEL